MPDPRRLLTDDQIADLSRTLRDTRLDFGRDWQAAMLVLVAVAGSEIAGAIRYAGERVAQAIERNGRK